MSLSMRMIRLTQLAFFDIASAIETRYFLVPWHWEAGAPIETGHDRSTERPPSILPSISVRVPLPATWSSSLTSNQHAPPPTGSSFSHCSSSASSSSSLSLPSIQPLPPPV
eukprot:CAMPEP_0198294458 /NCGR_PEP_ID=MMETSP1449-20131203/22428_1 /TAXON_ID=420275 /ORGANISM="Attheya septentrionalis, Strain CCMP2084" /LENGTH=110 /DNA_ID=CAMNT_0043994415 /DNA_START=454 /DNA_END=786 /DNA_ORIENTATION=-